MTSVSSSTKGGPYAIVLCDQKSKLLYSMSGCCHGCCFQLAVPGAAFERQLIDWLLLLIPASPSGSTLGQEGPLGAEFGPGRRSGTNVGTGWELWEEAKQSNVLLSFLHRWPPNPSTHAIGGRLEGWR